MDNRIRLRIMGISYNPVRSGAFALLLADEEGEKRIPILIGASEAQAIGIKMQGVIPPRPMTHDLFCSLGQAFGIQLEEVFIYRFEDGIFSSEITFRDREGKEAVLDARTSDAVAIAVRVGAPIYTPPKSWNVPVCPWRNVSPKTSIKIRRTGLAKHQKQNHKTRTKCPMNSSRRCSNS